MVVAKLCAAAFGLSLGSGLAVLVPVCEQTAQWVRECEECSEFIVNGPRPIGIWATQASSCQGAGQCNDCCIDIVASADDLNFTGVHLINETTGQYWDDTDSGGQGWYTILITVHATCSTISDSVVCIASVVEWADGGVIGGEQDCLRLRCKRCR